MISVHIKHFIKNFLLNFLINSRERFTGNFKNRHLAKIHKTHKNYSITFSFPHLYNYMEGST